VEEKPLLPLGDWVDTAKNISFKDGLLSAELKNNKGKW